MSAKVLVVMGSDSDWSVMETCVEQLHKFDIEAEVRVCSAHRTPVKLHHRRTAVRHGQCAGTGTVSPGGGLIDARCCCFASG